MTTTEQQIEKLLEDLDKYARDVDLYEYGLPLRHPFHAESFKALVKSFVDSLREDEAAVKGDPAWYENQ